MERTSLSNSTQSTKAIGGIRERKTKRGEHQISPRLDLMGFPSQREGFDW
jgi:hypothetical protein